ncbi:MAG TPA: 2-dehydropantoate 2-reductase [Alphaproteobacteria bacterium]|jgi:2-dehydropantoate 2-reductase|nr:2-dehydropantoate 2-reductase [Alphaproteobacteria bacterium]
MRICIAGVGAVGSVVAAYLLESRKHEVSVLARGEQLAAIRANGLRVDSRGRTLLGHPKASDNPKDLGLQDAIIVATKGYSVPSLAPVLKPLIGPGTLIVAAQNGIPWWYFFGVGGTENDTPFETVDPGAVVWRTLGPENAIGCVVTIPAERCAPGVVHHSGSLKLIMGAPKSGMHGNTLGALAAALNESGIETAVTDEIRYATWAKLQTQVGTAPIGVLTGGNNGQVADARELDGLKARVSAECVAIANAWNVPLAATITRASATNPSHKASILQDFEAGRPIELDAIVGAVLELARRRNVPAPMIDALWGLTKLRVKTRDSAGAPAAH